YDSSIEELGFSSVPQILNRSVTEGKDIIIMTGTTLVIDNLKLHINITGVIDLTIDCLGGDDEFDIQGTPPLLEHATFIGGNGNDTIFAPAGANTWAFTGDGDGSVTGDNPFDFNGIENVTGGAIADRFLFENDAVGLSGNLSGGGGTDTLDYEARTVTVSVDLGTEQASGIGGTFDSIEIIIGSSAMDTLSNASGIWNVTGVNTGDFDGTVTFSAMENITGGDENDTFNVTSGARMTGMISGGGGGGVDTLAFDTGSGNDSVVISGTAVTVNGVRQDYADMETLTVNTLEGTDNLALTAFPSRVNLNTGEDDDVIDISLATGVVTEISVDGGAPSASDSVTIHGTADADLITVDGLVVSFDTTLINLAAVEHLTVAGGAGNDMLSLIGDSASESVDLLGEGEDDSITITYPLSTGSLTVDGGAGDANDLSVVLTPDAEKVTIDAESIAIDGKTSPQYFNFASLSIDTSGSADSVSVVDTHSGTTTVATGADADAVDILATSGILSVDTGDDADTANIRSVSAETIVDMGGGEDTVNVSSNAPAGHTLDEIAANLSIIGGGGSDALSIDASGAGTSLFGSLSDSRVSGLGTTTGIGYAAFEALTLALGSGADELDIAGTHPGSTLVHTNAGGDAVQIYSIEGATTIDTGLGEDTLNVAVIDDQGGGEDEPDPEETPAPSLIAAALEIKGGDGSDTLNVASGSIFDEFGTMTSTTLTGLEMASGLTYGGLDAVNISLGYGRSVFTIESTHKGMTQLDTNAGDDTVHVLSTAGETTVNTGDDADTVNVQTIDAATTINAGAGSDNINVGSLTPLLAGGTVNGIAARLTVRGDEDNDTLNV
ncbi:beta strand repeat-containing protein, partial [Thermodesulfobacteriota bacterium]